ncbi:hypothetical protein FQA39_LY05956 [Lamprigera yunnana]|nr:hypothetical protein FQA39_LY05956 [Lamprigera yunnana]
MLFVSEKLWGGRFSASQSHDFEELNKSILTDKELYKEDLKVSYEYSRALASANLLTQDECNSIWKGLDEIASEWSNGTFLVKENDEDIHTANERRLKELIGEPGNKLHVGRSRNDQVATDMKMWLQSKVVELVAIIKDVIKIIVKRAADDIDVIMPGYTHLQRAQPVRWSHWILSHAWALKHDIDSLEAIKNSTGVMPLGSGALAGNPFPIDRDVLAASLGFAEVTQNSMYAVTDRDFVAEFLFRCSLVGIHLSRLAEDLIIFSSKEFGYVTLHDSYSSGSSLMPQKRNPDSLELIRGIGGSLFGHCCGFMMTLKALPSTYNKDLQTDKEGMIVTFKKLKSILGVAMGAIDTLTLNRSSCENALNFEMLSTDLAYYLVRKKIPFRKAHHLAGLVVADAEKKNKSIANMSLDELQLISEHFDEDVKKVWNYEHSVEQYEVIGVNNEGKIANIIERDRLRKFENDDNCEVIDVGEYVIMPGIIDSHVHVNEPGRTDWEGYETATKAAASGGITTVVDMPLNSIPPTTTLDNFYEKVKTANGKTHVDVAFWGGVIPNNQDELLNMIEAGVVGFKCFMCESGVDEFPKVTQEDIVEAMKILKNTNKVLAFHAEVDGDLEVLGKLTIPNKHVKVQVFIGDPTNFSTFLQTRPASMEVQAIEIIIDLAQKFGVRVHIVHLSAADALPLIVDAKQKGVHLTVETCHHYLSLKSEDVPNTATQFKCTPPIRDIENQNSLWEALKKNTIDMVVSDHSPCIPDLKVFESGDFIKAWGGISSLQFGLSLFWTQLQGRGLTIFDITKYMTYMPAKLTGLHHVKGRIAENYDADLVIWDPHATVEITENMIQHKNKVTPYLGRKLCGKVLKTVVRGQIVFEDGKEIGAPLGKLIHNFCLK